MSLYFRFEILIPEFQHCHESKKKYVQALTIKLRAASQHGNFKTACWDYFGQLIDGENNLVDPQRIFCKLCLEEQQKLFNDGHISIVLNFADLTSSGNLNNHLRDRHEVATNSEEQINKILGKILMFVTNK